MRERKPEEDILPEELIDALRSYSNQRVLVSAVSDQNVLRLAKQALRKRTGRHRARQRLWWAAAALAAIALVIFSILGIDRGRQQTMHNAPAVVAETGDLDGNGRVDIFDAFALARSLKQRTASPVGDVNGDGVVDGRDVATLAQRAVQLPKGGVL